MAGVTGVSGKYRLESRLGGGGMAEVFIGSAMGAEGFARRVAIKRVLPGYSNNPTFAQMFVAEAQLSARLAHPNIVSVLDFDRDAEQRLFLVMELVEGRDLHALNATGLLPFPLVIHIIAEVLRGLGHAHDAQLGGNVKGVVHRDVSPHNILLSWEGDVKVSDFGLAKARDASQATATDFVKGKPAYMSPEQANGQPLDGRSDLFAVGVMLWEMLTGKRLFSTEDTRATLAAVLFGKIPRPRQLRPEVPKDLEKVAMKLLEREPSARFRTARDAVRDLEVCAAATRGRELLVPLLHSRFASALHAEGTSPAAADVIVPRLERSTAWPWWLLACAVTAGVVAGAILARTSRRESVIAPPPLNVGISARPSIEGWFHVDDPVVVVAGDANIALVNAPGPAAVAVSPLAFDPSLIPPRCVALIATLENAANCSGTAARQLASYKDAILKHKADDLKMVDIEAQCEIALGALKTDAVRCGDAVIPRANGR